MAADISPIENIIPKYITTMIRVAISSPPQPADPMPKFQPEKSPEMTAATPRPHSPQKPRRAFELALLEVALACFGVRDS